MVHPENITNSSVYKQYYFTKCFLLQKEVKENKKINHVIFALLPLNCSTPFHSSYLSFFREEFPSQYLG